MVNFCSNIHNKIAIQTATLFFTELWRTIDYIAWSKNCRKQTLSNNAHTPLNIAETSVWIHLFTKPKVDLFRNFMFLSHKAIHAGKPQIHICDMIKGNESLVENFNSYFLAPLSHNSHMLHFDPSSITIGYLVTELWRICHC